MNPKECKGRGLARGFGCGVVGFYNSLHKGLCHTCWPDWLLNTEDGQEYLQRVQLKAKKYVKYEQKQRTTTAKRELLSVDAYRAKVLQPVINEIVRLIDYGQPCIASGVTRAKFSAGHFTSVGANRLIAMNVHNIHIQAYHSNGPQGGQPIEYLAGLREVYGYEYADFVMSLRGYRRTHKFNKSELEEAFKVSLRIRNRLRRNKAVRPPLQRLRLRDMVNRVVGLYPDSVFNKQLQT